MQAKTIEPIFRVWELDLKSRKSARFLASKVNENANVSSCTQEMWKLCLLTNAEQNVNFPFRQHGNGHE